MMFTNTTFNMTNGHSSKVKKGLSGVHKKSNGLKVLRKIDQFGLMGVPAWWVYYTMYGMK